MYTLKLPNLYPDYQLAVSLISGQHNEMFSQVSHSCERGAVRFLVWWLFLHRRLRSGNEAQLSLSRFAPFGGSSPKGTTRFYSSGSRKSRNLP